MLCVSGGDMGYMIGHKVNMDALQYLSGINWRINWKTVITELPLIL